LGALNTMPLGKSSLTAFSFNFGPQQPDNVIVIKHNRLTAEVVGKGNCGFPLHCARHDTFFELRGRVHS
jgi:hypothetical protein